MKEDVVILIAEDDAGHFALVKKNLWRSCIYNDILHFKDGQEILDFLCGRGEGIKRTKDTSYLLLLDIRMPKIDGLEVLKQIKKDGELRKIPVIMLTTTDNPVEVQKCYEAGCSFYIVKPGNYNEFMDAVERLGMFLSLDNVHVPAVDGV